MANYVDLKRLAQLTRAKRGNRGLREVSQEIGKISPSTLSRVENEKMPDMETFLLLCDWLNIAASELVKNTDDEKEKKDTTPDSIAAQLRSDKSLDPNTASVLATIIRAAYNEYGIEKSKSGDIYSSNIDEEDHD